MFEKMFDVTKVTGDQIVHRDNMKSFFNEAVTKVGSQKSRTAGYEYTFFIH